MRTVPDGGPSGQGTAKPFLTFTCRGPNLHMVQDLPISRPHTPAEVDALCVSHNVGGSSSGSTLCPVYLNLLPVAPRLLVRRLSH